MNNRIAKKFSYQAGGQLWKMYVDAIRPLLVIEIREKNTLSTSYMAVDLENYRLILEDFRYSDEWWLQLAGVCDGKMVFQSYPEPESPQTKGVAVYDLYTKALLWENENYRLAGIQKNQLAVYELFNEKREVLLLELLTGKELTMEQKINSIPDINSLVCNISFPLRYTSVDAYFEVIKDYVQKKENVQIMGSADYLEYENLVILSIFLEENKVFTNILLIFDSTARILLKEIIDKDLSGIPAETFWVFGKNLVYIKNNNELFIYQIII